MKKKVLQGLQGYRKNLIKILTVFMVLFPWITYLNLSEYSAEEKALFSGYDGFSIDFFLHYKEVAVILMAVLAAVWFLGERFLPQKVDNNVPLLKGKNKVLFILSGVYVAGLLISTIFSKCQKNALMGSPTVGEGFWALLGYLVLILAFYNVFVNEYAFDKVKIAITALCSITVVLTLIEWFYKPLLEIGLVQALVAPAKYAEIVSQMKATMFESAISLTFYNPGYFGGFVCLLLPFALWYALQEKVVVKKVGYAVLTVGLIFSMITANTTTSLYLAILEVAVVLAIYVFLSMKDGKEKSTSIMVQAAIILAVVVIGLFAGGSVSGNSVFNIFANSNSATNQVVEERFEIQDIQMEGNALTLVGEEASLKIYYVKGKLLFYDGNNKALAAKYEGHDIVLKDTAYENIKIQLKTVGESVKGVSMCAVIDAGYKDTVEFFILEDGTFSGIGQNGSIVMDIKDAGIPESWKGIYGAFTGRGYAWVNSIPLLKDTWLVGKGPGNFAYYFKQYDYVGLLSTHGTIKHLIDKPHNAYLQYAIEIGLPAALAFFGVFAYAVIKAAKVLWMRKKQLLANPIHIGAMVSVVSFLVYSLINDSMVTVTPVACMMVGLLLASCYVENPEV